MPEMGDAERAGAEARGRSSREASEEAGRIKSQASRATASLGWKRGGGFLPLSSSAFPPAIGRPGYAGAALEPMGLAQP